MPTLENALSLARAGWEVLPLRGKIPLTAHGVKDASADPAAVAAWWGNGATHNLGARVPQSLIVLDIDPQNCGSLDALEDASGSALPPTLTVHSGRGTGGRHLYFRHPGGIVTSTRLPRGIDVKTSTGYCVMPPSVHPVTGNPYRWESRAPEHLPAQLLALMRVAQHSVPRPSMRAGRRPGALGARALHLARYVQDAPEGTRNSRLFWAACQAVRDGHPELVFDLLEGASVAAGLSESEARRTIASARRQGTR